MKKILSIILASMATYALAVTPVAPPKIVVIPVTANLATILAAATPNASYQLVKGANYTSGPILISAANLNLDMNGASLSFGASSGFDIEASNVSIANGTISKAARAIVCANKQGKVVSGLSVSNMTFAATQQIYLDQYSGCLHATFSKITQTAPASYVAMYFTSDFFSLLGPSTLIGSTGEYALREESIVGGHDPVGAIIDHVTFSNDSNCCNKSAVGIRQGSIAISWTAFHGKNGYIRIGQLDPVTHCKVAGCNGTTTLSHVNFDDVTNPNPRVSIDEGVIVSIDSSLFTVDSTVRGVSVGSYSKVALTNNVIKKADPTVIPKGLYGAVTTNPSVVTETGTISE